MTTREKIAVALEQFAEAELYDAGINLFDVLGYNTSRRDRLDDNSYIGFAEMFIQDKPEFDTEKALVNEWSQVEFLFQLSEAEMGSQEDLFDTKEFNGTIIESYTFFAIGLKADIYPRSQLAQITREFNKLFGMPAMLIFKHGATLTLSIINRRFNKLDKSKDVLEKVTLIKDIKFTAPHRAHLEILLDLSIAELRRKYNFNNFVSLHEAWAKCLDTKELNKRFYQELANWYFWAMEIACFPNDIEKDQDIRNATNLIRLITRIIFVWFIKEKGLVPESFFNRNQISKILKDFNKNNESQSYYQAILQNLFFGTLNQKMSERAFAKDQGFPANRNEYGVKNLFRYAEKFKLSEKEVLALFVDIPFLNGGLFDCLDKEDEKGKVIYVDGFSRNKEKQAKLPDYLFFHEEQDVDLNETYGTKNKNYKVKGLIDILNSYKFTVTENTPLEEEIALDPELLGKVFENLLASYNPETQTTARKQTGSFYTRREIVNYMVDESLLAYLNHKLEQNKYGDNEEQLRQLLSFSEEPHSFDEKQSDLLIKAIDECKILDPACGSGAFPMGMLLKLVHVLHKLDPENNKWKEQQIVKVEKFIKDAEKNISDASVREKVINDLHQTLQDIEESFNIDNNELDYGRKLFLIENCIYGVDIQPIAVQIAKLRFFISLIIDQKKQSAKENLGIRALPNLETKFVAADTLIELEKPDIQGMFKDPEIEKLENEIKDLRHQYFNARSRKEKLQFQKKDRKLRQEIAECLVHDGWDNSVAKQIVSFNPYDQNSTSPFFDPEWMYGITDGFDIVIGNPPYGVSITGDYRKKITKSLGKVPDYEIYYYFIESSFKLLKQAGIKTYIIPNTYLFNVYAAEYRKSLLEKWKVISILDCTEFKIFEGVTIHNSITLFQKLKGDFDIGYKHTENATSFDELSQRPTIYVKKKELINHNRNWALIFKLDKDILKLTEVIRQKGKPLNVYFPDLSQGLIAYDKYQGQTKEIIESRVYHYNAKIKKDLKKWLWGEDVRKYYVEWNGKEYIDYCDGIANPRKPKYFKGPRALIREITNPSIFCAYTEDELYHDPAVIVVLESKQHSIKSLVALLNSKLFTFLHFNTSPKATKGSFPKILVDDVKNLPIPLLDSKTNIILERIVDYILFLNSQHENSMNTYFEHLIDCVVYELYFQERINITAANVISYLENLPDIKPLSEKDKTKEAFKIVERVYGELNTQDHPVSIASVKMQEIEEVKIIEGRN